MYLDIKKYHYQLPEEKIAGFPLNQRDESKLLVYRKGKIDHVIFRQIPDFLEKNNLIVFNNTRVIQARIIFHRKTGAKIEIFCLEPYFIKGNIDQSLGVVQKTRWKCMVGNKDKWRRNREILNLAKEFQGKNIDFEAELLDDFEKDSVIEFRWNNNLSFREILEIFGRTPIPPYLNRQDVPLDKENYQTVYARVNGAVAAPTAGFHFTENVMNSLRAKGIETDFLTLHVSAGTFQPVKEPNAIDHLMHHEQVIFTRKNIENLAKDNRKIIAAGTTSLRALESLYWFAIKILEGNDEFNIGKLFPYENHKILPGRHNAMNILLKYMDEKQLGELEGLTSIFIFPGYKFTMTDGLITNYHLPQSTLLLLVAAFIGEDWRKVYTEALNNGYRFLSYGDSSLLLP